MAPIATTTTTSTIPDPVKDTASATLRLNVQDSSAPAWLQQLRTDGWCVVPGVLPREKALSYADKMYKWVEDFGLGFDRNDPSTRTKDKLHFFYKGERCFQLKHKIWRKKIAYMGSLLTVAYRRPQQRVRYRARAIHVGHQAGARHHREIRADLGYQGAPRVFW
jgi:hypothetical protein